MLSRLTALAFLTTLVFAGCQSQDSSSPSGLGRLNPAEDPSFQPNDNPPTSIRNALAACIKDPGLANAGTTHLDNIVRKLGQGDTETAKSMAGAAINWYYEKNSQGQWKCSTQYLAATIWALATLVGILVPDVEVIEDTLEEGGGGICFADQGCKFLSSDGCEDGGDFASLGIEIPVQPGGGIYFVSLIPVEDDPFARDFPVPDVFPGLKAFPRFGAVHLEGLEGELPVPATVGLYVEDNPPHPLGAPPAVANEVQIGHIVFNAATDRDEVDILPKEILSGFLSCPQTAQTGLTDWLASLFLPTTLIANPGETGGKLSIFSFVGGVYPASDTKVGITPTITSLNDQQSVTLTATVSRSKVGDPDDESELTDNPISEAAGDLLEFLVDGVVWSQVAINASGQASLTLKCGVDFGAGSHTVDAHYLGTDTHAESSTTDPDSPTGTATVDCATLFTTINFDRDPDGKPLKNGEIVNAVYESLGVTFRRVRTASQTLCGTQNDVYAVSDPSTGNFPAASPPRVVTLCASGDSRISAGSNQHGWIRARFATAKSQVCIAVFPTTNPHRAELKAYGGGGLLGSSVTTSAAGANLCFPATGSSTIDSADFSGQASGNRLGKFDNWRFR